ncbi:Peptidase S1, PA clan, partial [Cinara cedri]
MNTWLYLMLIYSISITYTNLLDIEKIPPYFSTEHELPSEFYSAQETDLKDDKTNIPKHFFENEKYILQRLPDLAKDIAYAVTSDIATNVTPTWGELNNYITNLKKQIPNVNVSCSFKLDMVFYTINVKFNSILFGTKNYRFMVDRERIEDVVLSNLDMDTSNDELDNESDDEDYTTIPISSLGENVISITTEAEFVKLASDTHYFPYHVVIAVSIDEQDKWCQGVLIKSNWILTSRTCIK